MMEVFQILAIIIIAALLLLILSATVLTIWSLIIGIKTWKAGEDPFSKKE